MGKRQKTENKVVTIVAALICFVVGFALSVAGVFYVTLPDSYMIPPTEVYSGAVSSGTLNVDLITSQDLSIHFLELGNKYTGDCTLIKTGNTEILIDAGSRTDSIPTIKNYLDQYVTDGRLEYVIVTHAHQDHYAGFATNKSTDSIFDLFECEVIIDFAQTNQKPTSTMYANYQRELQDEVDQGAVHYTALDCVQGNNGAKSTYELGNGVTMQILDSYYYYAGNTSSSENDYSVCTLISNGKQNFLFTGDLEAKGEEYLVQYNHLPQVDVYKAGHHGSKTSSSAKLMEVIQPKIVCVCCCAGSSEYTTKDANQFPTQDFINHVAPYTTQVFVTTLCVDYKAGIFESMNGNIVVYCNKDDAAVTVNCANNATLLKDTDWFKAHRTLPNAWGTQGS